MIGVNQVKESKMSISGRRKKHMQIFGSKAEHRRFEELGEVQRHLSRGRRRWEVGIKV